MARISELHYLDAVAANTGTSEFIEVALAVGEDPNDFVLSLYDQDGSEGLQVSLNDPLIQVHFDAESNENVYVISSDDFAFNLNSATSGAADNYEAVALTDTAGGNVLDFYDIGVDGGAVTAIDGLASGVTSDNLIDADAADDESIQFNQPNPDNQRNRELSEGDSSNCFTPTVPIMTPDGEVPAGDLSIGDMVMTIDRGPQPIRYVYRRKFRAVGQARPVLFKKGAVRNSADLIVSQAHRILIQPKGDTTANGQLVNAIHLVNGDSIRLLTDLDEVEYIHLMLDQHELLWSAGIATESWQPHRRNLRRFDRNVRQELLTFFPEIRHHTGANLQLGGPVRSPWAPPALH